MIATADTDGTFTDRAAHDRDSGQLERFQIIRGHTLRPRSNFGILPA